jgi:hypothetical protein
MSIVQQIAGEVWQLKNDFSGDIGMTVGRDENGEVPRHMCRDAGGSDRGLMRPERQATRIRASSLVSWLRTSPLLVLK